MIVYLTGEDLARVAGNCMKFVPTRGLFMPNEVFFELEPNQFRIYSTDGYIAITDSAQCGGDDVQCTFSLSLSAVKEIEAFARENKKYDVHLNFDLDAEKIRIFDATRTNEYDFAECHKDDWEMVRSIIWDEVDFTPAEVGVIAFSPERWAKFSTLKHNKEAPMDFKFLEHKTTKNVIARLKLGATIRGAVMPIKRTVIDSALLW